MGLDLFPPDPGVRGLFAAAVEVLDRGMRSRRSGRTGKTLDQTIDTQPPVLSVALTEQLAVALAGTDFRSTAFPVIPNCNPDLNHPRKQTPEPLVRRITAPMRWRETLEKAAAPGIAAIGAFGPRRVLSGMIRRIDRRLRLLNIQKNPSLNQTAAALGPADDPARRACRPGES
jgi:malonyl CoA-acyl carrier protein transacylase